MDEAKELLQMIAGGFFPDHPEIAAIFARFALDQRRILTPNEFIDLAAPEDSGLSVDERGHYISFLLDLTMVKAPRVMISYSHDSEEHKRWVHDLATSCREGGIDVILDLWDLRPGMDVTHFMEQSLSDAAKILVVCTDAYVDKANNMKGGVGYERMIITGELATNLETEKFIPIVRQRSTLTGLPTFLSNRLYIDFSEDDAFDSSFERLLRLLHGKSEYEKPNLGRNPYKD